MWRFWEQLSLLKRLGAVLGLASLASVVFWAAGAIMNHSTEYWYLAWNLFLAWVPLGLAVWLATVLRTRDWAEWLPPLIALLWLGFLPNSFYVISDFVHLQEVPRIDVVFDVAMLGSFAINGLLLGYISLFIVHQELRKRLTARLSNLLVALVLLMASFAIYIGRDLRWNTWDVFVNPAGLLFDISDRLMNAAVRPEVATTTLSFFVLLGSTYVVIWYAIKVVRRLKLSD